MIPLISLPPLYTKENHKAKTYIMKIEQKISKLREKVLRRIKSEVKDNIKDMKQEIDDLR